VNAQVNTAREPAGGPLNGAAKRPVSPHFRTDNGQGFHRSQAIYQRFSAVK